MGRDRVVRRTYEVLYLIAIIVVIGIALLWSDVFGTDQSFRLRKFSDNWVDQWGTHVDLNNVYTRDYDGDVIVGKELPHKVYDDDAICFSSRNVDFTVWIDDEEVYEFVSKTNLTGKGYGIAFHTIALNSSDAEKNIKIQFAPSVPNGTINGQIKQVALGTESDYIRDFLRNKILLITLSVLLIFIGAIISLFHFWIPDKRTLPYNILSLGISALILGTWSLIDSNVLQLITGKIYVWRELNKTLLFFVGYPLVSFFLSLTKTKRIIFRHIEFFASLFLLGLLIALRYVAGVDLYFSFSYILAIYIILTFGLIITAMVDNRNYCLRMGYQTEIEFFNAAYVLIFVSFLSDYLISRVSKNSMDSYGTLSRIGLFLFVIIVMWQFLRWWTKDQASVGYDRFINRALQFAVSSNSPEESIRLLLEYVGNVLGAKRTYIYEDKKNGSFAGTYEWFAEGMDPRRKEYLEVPYEGFVEPLIDYFREKDHCIAIRNIDRYMDEYPKVYAALKQNEVEKTVLGPLGTNGEYIGFFGVDNAPEDSLEDVSQVMEMLGYFFSQFITQRDEQERLVYYSYYDVISGARNRSSFKEFIDKKLNTAQPFGYAICQINELKAINESYGHEAGDRIVKDVSRSLIDVFGDGYVFRISGEEFVCFGFETDETFFNNDIARVRRMIRQKDCIVFFGTVFCANGTVNLKLVRDRAAEILSQEKSGYAEGESN